MIGPFLKRNLSLLTDLAVSQRSPQRSLSISSLISVRAQQEPVPHVMGRLGVNGKAHHSPWQWTPADSALLWHLDRTISMDNKQGHLVTCVTEQEDELQYRLGYIRRAPAGPSNRKD